MSTNGWPLLVAVSAALAACGPRTPAEVPAGTERLVGIWTASLITDATTRRGRSGIGDTVRGEFAILPAASNAPRALLGGPATHVGTHTLTMDDLGASDGMPVGTLVARLVGADSLEISLQPERRDPLRMRGLMLGDSIVGRWSHSRLRGGSASGHFVIRRRHTS